VVILGGKNPLIMHTASSCTEVFGAAGVLVKAGESRVFIGSKILKFLGALSKGKIKEIIRFYL